MILNQIAKFKLPTIINRITTHSVIGFLNAPMLAFFTLNPPVDNVEKEIVIASNQVTSGLVNLNKTVCNTVKNK